AHQQGGGRRDWLADPPPCRAAGPGTPPLPLPSLAPIPTRSQRTSHHLREEGFAHLRQLPASWTRSIYLSTAGNVGQELIQRYLDGQAKTCVSARRRCPSASSIPHGIRRPISRRTARNPRELA